MIKKLTKSLVIGIAMICSVCEAADIPRPSQRDSRIQYIQYRENDVVQMSIVVGTGSRIVFSEDEEIVNIAAGFTQGWQLEPVGNELFVSARSLQLNQNGPMTRPVPGEWDTNVMVTTTRGLYDFDVRLLEKDGRKDGTRAFFRIEFEYPETEREGQENGLAESLFNASSTTDLAASESSDVRIPSIRESSRSAPNASSAPKNATTGARELPPRNDEYEMIIGRQSKDIAPSAAYDDGLFTYLKFKNNLDIPAAYLVRQSGTEEIETLVNAHVDPQRPEFIVIHRVAKKLRLRLGDSVVDVYNQNYDPSSVSASEGTTVPGLKRILK